MTDHLEAALATSGDAALDHLIAAWQQDRNPELADIVEATGAALEPTLGADPSDLDAWLKTAAKATARQRGELLARLDGTKWKRALAQIEVIETWPDDPRTAAALVDLVVRAPHRSDPSRALWTRVYALVRRLADPRSAAGLPEPEAYGDSFPRDKTKRWITREIRALSEGLTAIEAPDPLDEATRARLRERVPARPAATTRTAEELLAEIYEDPTNDAPRMVYADLLSSRGDPRGEFIALQLLATLGKDQRARIKALLREHQAAWLGELGDVMLMSELGFARGFPVAGCLDGGAYGRAIEQVTDNPRWRTFEALDVRGDREGYHRFLASEAFYGLETLTTVSPSALVNFAAPAPRALRHLRFSGDDGLTALGRYEGLPKLRELGVLYWSRSKPFEPQLREFLETPLGEQIERLEIHQSSEAVGTIEDWVVTALEADLDIDELVVTGTKGFRHAAGFHYELRRHEGQWTIAATYKTRPKKADNFGLLADMLTRLREQPIAKLTLKTPRYTPEQTALTKVRQAALKIDTVTL